MAVGDSFLGYTPFYAKGDSGAEILFTKERPQGERLHGTIAD